RFSPHRGEDPLDTPWFVRFRHPRLLLEDDELRDGWLDAARLELERRSATPYHRHHSYTAFRMIAGATLQRRVLGEVLSAGTVPARYPAPGQALHPLPIGHAGVTRGRSA